MKGILIFEFVYRTEPRRAEEKADCITAIHLSIICLYVIFILKFSHTKVKYLCTELKEMREEKLATFPGSLSLEEKLEYRITF